MQDKKEEEEEEEEEVVLENLPSPHTFAPLYLLMTSTMPGRLGGDGLTDR